MLYKGWLGKILFGLAAILILIFCFCWGFNRINPIYETKYVFNCVDGIEYQQVLIDIARLEGVVMTLQKMIPIYGGLVIVVILFLTWGQSEKAKSAAIVEINTNFGMYKDRLVRMEAESRRLMEQIKSFSLTFDLLKNGKVSDIINLQSFTPPSDDELN